MDCFSILLAKKQDDNKADRMLKIKLPLQSHSGTPDLRTTKSPSPDLNYRLRKKDMQVAIKTPILLPHLSLTLDQHTQSVSTQFRPSPRRTMLRITESGKVKRRFRVVSQAASRTDEVSVQLRSATPAVKVSLAKKSPVVSLRAKSPLTRFRQAFPIRHRAAKSMFEACK